MTKNDPTPTNTARGAEAWFAETIETTGRADVREILRARAIDRLDLLRVARTDAGSVDSAGRTTLTAVEVAAMTGFRTRFVRRCRRALVELRCYTFESSLPSDGESRFQLPAT